MKLWLEFGSRSHTVRNISDVKSSGDCSALLFCPALEIIISHFVAKPVIQVTKLQGIMWFDSSNINTRGGGGERYIIMLSYIYSIIQDLNSPESGEWLLWCQQKLWLLLWLTLCFLTPSPCWSPLPASSISLLSCAFLIPSVVSLWGSHTCANSSWYPLSGGGVSAPQIPVCTYPIRARVYGSSLLTCRGWGKIHSLSIVCGFIKYFSSQFRALLWMWIYILK